MQYLIATSYWNFLCGCNLLWKISVCKSEKGKYKLSNTYLFSVINNKYSKIEGNFSHLLLSGIIFKRILLKDLLLEKLIYYIKRMKRMKHC